MATHDIKGFEECSLFDSPHAYADGYSRAVCTCGWKSAPCKQNSLAIVAMHTAHAERAERQEAAR